MHDKFLDGLKKISDVKLVSKLKDDNIGLPYSSIIRIFIPDLHMYSRERYELYNYECITNYNENRDDLLPTLCKYLKEFKMENQGKEVLVYQLGDLIDFWRETPKPWKVNSADWENVIQKIIDSNHYTWDNLVDESLHTNFLLGNHDFDMFRIPEFYSRYHYLRYYFSDETGVPKAGAFHGDIFTWYKKIPDWIEQLAVYYDPLEKGKRFVKKLSKLILETHKQKGKFINYKKEPKKKLFHLGQLEDPNEFAEPIHNIRYKRPNRREGLEHLSKAKEFFMKVNNKTGYQLGLAIIGHTHDARIAVDDTNKDKPFILLDCGAWVKKSKALVKEGTDYVEKEVFNAQIGVLCNNDARIYQLSKL
jgi:UDP-2,3-diacylglucosamine pyrophosphatase LpxH